MTGGEASDVSILLSYLAGRRPDRSDGRGPVEPQQAREAAERLADRAFKATYAGWTGQRFREAMLGSEPAVLSAEQAEAEMLAGFRGGSGYRGELHHLLATAFEVDAGECIHPSPPCCDCLAAIAVRTLAEGRAT